MEEGGAGREARREGRGIREMVLGAALLKTEKGHTIFKLNCSKKSLNNIKLKK